MGNAGALYHIKNSLTEDFLLINGDLMFNVDMKRFIGFHNEHKALASILVHLAVLPMTAG